jgi:hypothetical protein
MFLSMGKVYKNISSELGRWIRNQHVFFVATAPLTPDGHINCSPKGGDSFRIIDSLSVVYQDFTGSGVETIAHIKENKRMVIMFCAFKGPPKIVRLHGQGEAILPGHPEFQTLANLFSEDPGMRAIIRLRVSRISDSCGYGVPFFDFRGERESLEKWASSKGPVALEAYRKENNECSIDDLPGIDPPKE